MGRKTLTGIPKLVLLIFSSFVILNSSYAFASTCMTPQDLASPTFEKTADIIAFYEEPWNNWLLDIMGNIYADQPGKVNILRRVYENSGFRLIFFEDNMSPKSSINVLLWHVASLYSLEGKKFPEFDSVLKELAMIKQMLSHEAKLPKDISRSSIKFCLSRSTAERIYISGLVDNPDRETRLKKWAYNRIKWQISLINMIVKADIQLTGMLFRYINLVNPFIMEKLDVRKYTENNKKLNNYLNSLHPQSRHYKVLINNLNKYKELEAASQIEIKKGPSLKIGTSGAAVLDLQKRLYQEGYLSKDAITGIFDALTEKAVKLFQKTHFLETDGIVGPKTRKKLNIPFSEKYKWIRISLDKLRNCPCRILNQYVWINIPTFSLEYHNNGKLVSIHKVIVGKTTGSRMIMRKVRMHRNNTLPLISEIKAVVFNPRWYVPERIRQELEKDIEKDPDFFKKGGFRTLKNSLYSWGEPRIYQLPGEKNPLGRVKFIFDNPFGIFLHDTSQPKLFGKPFRAFSHGCIRVEKALDLARSILADTSPEAFRKIKIYLSRKDQTYITLKKAVPIFITYIPVLADMDGELMFGGDIYGWMKNGRIPEFFYIK